MLDIKSATSAFTTIYRDNHWGTGSGIGSIPKHAKPYMLMIARFIRDNDIRSVVDIGCGDWQFSSLMDWRGVSYHGFDVVDSVVGANREKYGCDGIAFDVITDLADLPSADLVLCKDVLQHLPNADALTYLDFFERTYRFSL